MEAAKRHNPETSITIGSPPPEYSSLLPCSACWLGLVAEWVVWWGSWRFSRGACCGVAGLGLGLDVACTRSQTVYKVIIRRVGVSEWAPALRRVLSQECPALALARIRVEWSMEGVELRGSSWGGSSAGCTGSGGTLTLATTHEPHGH